MSEMVTEEVLEGETFNRPVMNIQQTRGISSLRRRPGFSGSRQWLHLCNIKNKIS